MTHRYKITQNDDNKNDPTNTYIGMQLLHGPVSESESESDSNNTAFIEKLLLLVECII
jgi:hypothetical protein